MKSSYRLVFVILLLTFLSSAGSGQVPNYISQAPDLTTALRGDGGIGTKVDSLFREYDRRDVPGASVIIIKDRKVLFKKAYGAANLEDKIASTSGTNYRLASVTKQFTAMAIMILAERKKLSYDSRLTDFFPGFPEYGRQITVRHLLNHTSGLLAYEDLIPGGTTTPLADNDVLQMMKQLEPPAQAGSVNNVANASRQAATPVLYFPPGSRFRYSNTGFVLLGLIVEKVSGKSFPEFLRQNIFQPLGMKHTRFYQRVDQSDDRRRAYGYTKQGDAFVRTDQSLTSSTQGDGAIYSSVDDLYKWDQALYTTRLVKAETLRQAFTPGIAINEKSGYGFGWFIENRRGMRMIWHSGNTIGFSLLIRRFPDQRFTLIVQTNRNDALLAEIADKIDKLYLSEGN
jgi:CubicO group peptidase (beta-lactamase class C family)